jgi:hypothetical protein
MAQPLCASEPAPVAKIRKYNKFRRLHCPREMVWMLLYILSECDWTVGGPPSPPLRLRLFNRIRPLKNPEETAAPAAPHRQRVAALTRNDQYAPKSGKHSARDAFWFMPDRARPSMRPYTRMVPNRKRSGTDIAECIYVIALRDLPLRSRSHPHAVGFSSAV